jgi:hypothetical protein
VTAHYGGGDSHVIWSFGWRGAGGGEPWWWQRFSIEISQIAFEDMAWGHWEVRLRAYVRDMVPLFIKRDESPWRNFIML